MRTVAAQVRVLAYNKIHVRSDLFLVHTVGVFVPTETCLAMLAGLDAVDLATQTVFNLALQTFASVLVHQARLTQASFRIRLANMTLHAGFCPRKHAGLTAACALVQLEVYHSLALVL